MKNQLLEIAHRRRMLLGKIESQRMEVAEISRHFVKPVAIADLVLKAAHFIRNHPALSSSVMAALMALRRKSIAGLFQKGRHFLHILPFFGSWFTK